MYVYRYRTRISYFERLGTQKGGNVSDYNHTTNNNARRGVGKYCNQTAAKKLDAPRLLCCKRYSFIHVCGGEKKGYDGKI